VYWLRRIPAETRIVVLVVFLALFQAILLSVFGLGAIEGERHQADQQLRLRAEHFLNEYVVARCQNGLRDRAEEVFHAAFERAEPAWTGGDAVDGSAGASAAGPGAAGAGIFHDAFLVRADGRILSPDGLPLLMPRALAEADQEAARAEARSIRDAAAADPVDPARRVALGLEFARRHPFATDDLGASLALVFAATPLLAGEGPGPDGGSVGAADGGADEGGKGTGTAAAAGGPDLATLLAIRWTAVLNRMTGWVDPAEVALVLDRVDAAAAAAGSGGVEDRSGPRPYEVARAAQDERVRLLQALDRERSRFAPDGPPSLHRNVLIDADPLFYVRPIGGDGSFQVLAVDRRRLDDFLGGVAARARESAREGIEPSVGAEGAGVGAEHVQVGIPELPGYVAVARIRPAAVREAGDRERFYQYIIGFSIAGILAGGFLTARVVMREVRLAKLKSGFVSNVSHELKTPLTSIQMFAEMLRSGKVTEPEERDECLNVISQETERLGKLIQQVLDFGRLEARRRRFRWIVGSLRPVVEKEADRFQRATGLGPEEFDVLVAVNLPPVSHDPDAFTEVITNLLSNAYKYSPPEGRRISLTLGPHRGRVVLSVEDNGPGVPPRERRKIFEQFYRADDLLTRDVEGTGLGLSIALNIVRAHGGRIHVEDSSLGGSRFVVVLPAAGSPAPIPTPAESTP